MRPKPRILATRITARSRLFRIQELDLLFANGHRACYERLLGWTGGAVLIVPMPDPDTLYLVREYAAGTDRYELGFPKGRIENGEDPLAAAGRELREEIGLAARRLEPLRAVGVAPGYLAHTTWLVLASQLYPDPLPGDEPEAPEVVPWPVTEAEVLLQQEDFTESRSITALFLTLRHLGRLRELP